MAHIILIMLCLAVGLAMRASIQVSSAIMGSGNARVWLQAFSVGKAAGTAMAAAAESAAAGADMSTLPR